MAPAGAFHVKHHARSRRSCPTRSPVRRDVPPPSSTRPPFGDRATGNERGGRGLQAEGSSRPLSPPFRLARSPPRPSSVPCSACLPTVDRTLRRFRHPPPGDPLPHHAASRRRTCRQAMYPGPPNPGSRIATTKGQRGSGVRTRAPADRTTLLRSPAGPGCRPEMRSNGPPNPPASPTSGPLPGTFSEQAPGAFPRSFPQMSPSVLFHVKQPLWQRYPAYNPKLSRILTFGTVRITRLFHVVVPRSFPFLRSHPGGRCGDRGPMRP
jgi:hypothetical protein